MNDHRRPAVEEHVALEHGSVDRFRRVADDDAQPDVAAELGHERRPGVGLPKIRPVNRLHMTSLVYVLVTRESARPRTTRHGRSRRRCLVHFSESPPNVRFHPRLGQVSFALTSRRTTIVIIASSGRSSGRADLVVESCVG